MAWRSGVMAGAMSLAAVIGSENSLAAGNCTGRNELMTLKLAEIQQQLLVSAARCHDHDQYNRFQKMYGPALALSDRTMHDVFRANGGGDAAYAAFKDELAKGAQLRSMTDKEEFCAEARTEFGAAFDGRDPMEDMIASQHTYVDLPIPDCASATYASANRDPNAPPTLGQESVLPTEPRPLAVGNMIVAQIPKLDLPAASHAMPPTMPLAMPPVSRALPPLQRPPAPALIGVANAAPPSPPRFDVASAAPAAPSRPAIVPPVGRVAMASPPPRAAASAPSRALVPSISSHDAEIRVAAAVVATASAAAQAVASLFGAGLESSAAPAAHSQPPVAVAGLSPGHAVAVAPPHPVPLKSAPAVVAHATVPGARTAVAMEAPRHPSSHLVASAAVTHRMMAAAAPPALRLLHAPDRIALAHDLAVLAHIGRATLRHGHHPHVHAAPPNTVLVAQLPKFDMRSVRIAAVERPAVRVASAEPDQHRTSQPAPEHVARDRVVAAERPAPLRHEVAPAAIGGVAALSNKPVAQIPEMTARLAEVAARAAVLLRNEAAQRLADRHSALHRAMAAMDIVPGAAKPNATASTTKLAAIAPEPETTDAADNSEVLPARHAAHRGRDAEHNDFDLPRAESVPQPQEPTAAMTLAADRAAVLLQTEEAVRVAMIQREQTALASRRVAHHSPKPPAQTASAQNVAPPAFRTPIHAAIPKAAPVQTAEAGTPMGLPQHAPAHRVASASVQAASVRLIRPIAVVGVPLAQAGPANVQDAANATKMQIPHDPGKATTYYPQADKADMLGGRNPHSHGSDGNSTGGSAPQQNGGADQGLDDQGTSNDNWNSDAGDTYAYDDGSGRGAGNAFRRRHRQAAFDNYGRDPYDSYGDAPDSPTPYSSWQGDTRGPYWQDQ